jgi:hypothetical protein
MSTYCKTPYKDSFPDMGAARAVMKAIKRRSRRGKTRSLPAEPYRCRCGSVHFADPRQSRGHKRVAS